MKDNIQQEIERSIIGICLLEATAIGRTYGLIEPKHFYSAQNFQTYLVLKKMYDQNIPIDHVTVWQNLLTENTLVPKDDIAYYLTTLSKNVVSSVHLEYHCHMLKEAWKQRELLRLTSSGVDGSTETSKQIAELTEQLNEIRGSEFKTDWYDMSELMVGLIKHQQLVAEGKKVFITTGLNTIDKINGGFSAGDMIVIGARPSVGKTAFMAMMALAMAKIGKKVGIISLEMNNEQ